MSRFSIKPMYFFRLIQHAYNENCDANHAKYEV